VIGSSQGHLYFWGERALYLGPGLAASLHAHHAVQVCIPLSGTVRLRTRPRARWREYEAAVISADQPHESDVAVDVIASLWVEPDGGSAGRPMQSGARLAILPVERSRLGTLVARLLACWAEGWDVQRAGELVDGIVEAVAPDPRSNPPRNPRVARALEILAASPERKVRLADLAAGVSLSPSRIAHLLSAEIGLPARRYLLWLRLRDALQALARGASITDAAHAAGFADAPHLDRTFRRMLGFTPSAALRVSKFVQDVSPGSR
jgi:AraC-like DNA-binding protein